MAAREASERPGSPTSTRPGVVDRLGEAMREAARGFPVPLDRSFAGLYGLEITEFTGDRACAEVLVREDVKQPLGLVNGGVYASMAEDIASLATGWTVFTEEGKTAVGLSNQTSFLRPITEGRVRAEAVVLHRGRTTWLWDVRFTDDEGRLCATTRITMAIRQPR